MDRSKKKYKNRSFLKSKKYFFYENKISKMEGLDR